MTSVGGPVSNPQFFESWPSPAQALDAEPLPDFQQSLPTPETAAMAVQPFLLSHGVGMALLDLPVPATCAWLRRFVNDSELASWMAPFSNETIVRYGWDFGGDGWGMGSLTTLDTTTDFSNNQVAGVDEADFTKTDGARLYARQGSSVVVAQIYPPESASVLERVPVNGSLQALLIDPTHLAVISVQSYTLLIKVYDRTVSPLVMKHEITFNGTYVGARAVGDHIFVVSNFALRANTRLYLGGGASTTVTLPALTYDGAVRALVAPDIGYLDSSRNASNLLTLIKLNLSASEAPSLTTLLSDAGGTMYVSPSNLYLAGGQTMGRLSTGREVTPIHKLPLRRGAVECAASGEVPGRVLNQFSMDEYGGNLRVATTLGHVAKVGGDATSIVTVLSEDLSPLGSLEGLAPGERIYSARFMGERLYLVTFKKVDPLFVINLSDPAAPSVLGYLKIPGFSDYLHPVADGFLVGVGKDTVEAQTGDFAWFQGVKLSLFDVRDFEHPAEVAHLVIGDRGSWTPVSTDHLAFTWIPERSMLVLPIHVFEINWSRAGASASASTYGQEVWQGAYVIRVSVEAGFEVVHKIPYEGEPVRATCSWWSWGGSTPGFTRSFVVEPYVYTIAPDRVEAHSLDSGTRAMDLRLVEGAQTAAPTARVCPAD